VNNLLSVAVALFGTLQLVGGCSLLVDASRPQCKSDGDCAALGGDLAGTVCLESFCQASPRWGCLDSPAAAPPASGEFTLTFSIKDTVNRQPKPGLNARLCRRLDLGCTEVVTPAGVTDAQGSVSLKAPAGFDGYVRLEGGDVFPAMYFFNPPISKDLKDISVSLSTFPVTGNIISLTGASQKVDRGLVLASVVDCVGGPAEGIKLSSSILDAESKVFYAANNLPSAIATETDAVGYGGIVNVSPGPVTLSATQSATGREIDRITVLVQAGMMSIVTLVAHGK